MSKKNLSISASSQMESGHAKRLVQVEEFSTGWPYTIVFTPLVIVLLIDDVELKPGPLLSTGPASQLAGRQLEHHLC